jgi:anti-anti-sigma factor
MTQFNLTDDKLCVVFESRLDSFNCSKVESDLMKQIAETEKPIEFDLKEVEFVASSFLRICLSSFQKVGVDRFSIINMSPNVKKVFKIAGMDSLLTME